MTQKYVYKIRRLSDGKYSTGGCRPKFTKSGKAWSNIGMLKSHLNMLVVEYEYNNIYEGCVIDTFMIEEHSVASAYRLGNLIDEYKEKKRKQDEKYEEWKKAYRHE